MAAVEVSRLSFTYAAADAPALKGVDLSIADGEFCSIIGANGAGKTTLCSAIRGFVPQFHKGELTGTVTIGGKDIAQTSIGDLAREIGFVFQNPFTQMSGIARTVFDELAFGLGNLGVPPAEIRERVEEMLETARIAEFRDRDPFALSGGQQQRVALASMLIMGQDTLVIDEPTSQLDPASTDEVFALIGAMKDAGRTIVLVEHKMEHVATYSDTVVLLHEGRVVLTGPPAEVFGDARTTEHGTRLPPAVLLARALRERGVDLPELPLSVAELTRAVRELLGEDASA